MLALYDDPAGRASAGRVEPGPAAGRIGGEAALRRVATLVAEGAPAADLFAAVGREIVRDLDVPVVALFRYEPDGAATAIASENAPRLPVGSRWPAGAADLPARVFRTGRPARIDDCAELPPPRAAGIHRMGLRAAIGVPIVVDAGVWGLICAGAAGGEPLPRGTEDRLLDFAELVAIAISNAESRDRLRRLADQQAALRRVATRAAEGVTPEVLFATVAEEVGRILDVSSVTVVRYEGGTQGLVLASFNDPALPVGSRWPLDGPGLLTSVFRTGRSARVDDYAELSGPVAAAARASDLESGVGVPIVVEGAVWGMIAVGRRRRREALPVFAGNYTGRLVLSTASAADVEAGLAAFTELAATAIAKAQAHDDLRRLAQEQAALRRVATLVAQAAAADQVFTAVADEVAGLLGLEGVEMARYEADGSATVIAAAGRHPSPTGTRWRLEGPSMMAAVLGTGRPARVDDYRAFDSAVAEHNRRAGIRSAIAAPIVVDGGTWGVMIAFSSADDRIPERSELQLNEFTELVATAVSNATARADLIASRARIVFAGDEARRRLERNLHDGTQQRLLALGLDLQRIRQAIPEEHRSAHAGLEQASSDLESILGEVRELSRGLHPARLSRSGLTVALRALARRSPIPVDVDVQLGERLPAPIETAVYYVVSEALANAIKHSRATAVSVSVDTDGTVLHARIADDGVGGARAGSGSGLVGLDDRVEALGGRFALSSPRGCGTTVWIELPVMP